MQLHYPELELPAGWTYFRQESQIRLIPRDTAPATIIVSPIVACDTRLPSLEQLVAYAIEHEANVSLEISELRGPARIANDHGLVGVYYELVAYPRPALPVEHRAYALLADDRCVYGVSYVASPTSFRTHSAAYRAVVASLRPFRGRVVARPSQVDALLAYIDV